MWFKIVLTEKSCTPEIYVVGTDSKESAQDFADELVRSELACGVPQSYLSCTLTQIGEGKGLAANDPQITEADYVYYL